MSKREPLPPTEIDVLKRRIDHQTAFNLKQGLILRQARLKISALELELAMVKKQLEEK